MIGKLIVAAAAIAMGTAAPAHADMDDFIYDLSSIGVTDPAAARDAYAICAALHQGGTPNSIASALYNNSAANMGYNAVTWSQAHAMVIFAMQDVCPY